MDLAAAPGRRSDETVDGLAAGRLLAFLGVKLEVEAVAILGKGNQTVVRFVGPQDGCHRGQGDDRQIRISSMMDSRALDRGKLS